MSQRVKKPGRSETEAQAKRRRRRPSGSDCDEDGTRSGSNSGGNGSLSGMWTPRHLSDLKVSSIYNRNSAEAPAELYRKDLISAMKLPDSEPLVNDEYWLITDPWKQEWEKGVQVPVNPESLPEPEVVLISPVAERSRDFRLPKKKYVRVTHDDFFNPGYHQLVSTAARAEKVCSYDLDDVDAAWLGCSNADRGMGNQPVISEFLMEQVIEELELQCWEQVQTILKSQEGLGIEYDENVICDVCRSPESEEGNEMVFCDSCNICVHQACYGITTIPSGSWLCRTCTIGIRPSCILCPNVGGAMKATRSGHKWAHVACAIWIPEVSIGSVEKMEPLTKISSIPQSRWNLVCVLCKEKTGACIQCSVKTCKTAYHVTCAFKNGLEMKPIIVDENAEDGIKLRSYCQKHSVNTKKDKSAASGSEEENEKKKVKAMTAEERNQARAEKLQQIESEFYKYVRLKDVSQNLAVDMDIVNLIFNYWKLKRKSLNNRPLVPPRPETTQLLTQQQEQDLEQMKMFVQLRQDLERVRNLCYMVSRREKLSRTFFRLREQTFQKQVAILTEKSFDLDSLSTAERGAILDANHGPSIYDQFYSQPGNVSSQKDYETLITLIGGSLPTGPKKKGSKKDMNPYKKKFVNGTRRRNSLVGDSSLSESEVSAEETKGPRPRKPLSYLFDTDSSEGGRKKNKVVPGSSSDSDLDLLPMVGNKSKPGASAIYSDTDTESKKKVVVKEKKKPMPKKDIGKKEPVGKGRGGRKKKDFNPEFLVPQREAAKKATESIRSVKGRKEGESTVKDASPQKVEEIIKKDVKKSSPERKPPNVNMVRKRGEDDEGNPKNVSYVPQRQAAKKAAEHIRSGLSNIVAARLIIEDEMEAARKKSKGGDKSPKARPKTPPHDIFDELVAKKAENLASVASPNKPKVKAAPKGGEWRKGPDSPFLDKGSQSRRSRERSSSSSSSSSGSSSSGSSSSSRSSSSSSSSASPEPIVSRKSPPPLDHLSSGPGRKLKTSERCPNGGLRATASPRAKSPPKGRRPAKPRPRRGSAASAQPSSAERSPTRKVRNVPSPDRRGNAKDGTPKGKPQEAKSPRRNRKPKVEEAEARRKESAAAAKALIKAELHLSSDSEPERKSPARIRSRNASLRPSDIRNKPMPKTKKKELGILSDSESAEEKENSLIPQAEPMKKTPLVPLTPAIENKDSEPEMKRPRLEPLPEFPEPHTSSDTLVITSPPMVSDPLPCSTAVTTPTPASSPIKTTCPIPNVPSVTVSLGVSTSTSNTLTISSGVGETCKKVISPRPSISSVPLVLPIPLISPIGLLSAGRSLFSPRSSKEGDMLEFGDQDLYDLARCVSEEALHEEEASNSLSFSFSKEFLSREDNKEDSARATLNLVEKLRLQHARKSGTIHRTSTENPEEEEKEESPPKEKEEPPSWGGKKGEEEVAVVRTMMSPPLLTLPGLPYGAGSLRPMFHPSMAPPLPNMVIPPYFPIPKGSPSLVGPLKTSPLLSPPFPHFRAGGNLRSPSSSPGQREVGEKNVNMAPLSKPPLTSPSLILAPSNVKTMTPPPQSTVAQIIESVVNNHSGGKSTNSGKGHSTPGKSPQTRAGEVSDFSAILSNKNTENIIVPKGKAPAPPPPPIVTSLSPKGSGRGRRPTTPRVKSERIPEDASPRGKGRGEKKTSTSPGRGKTTPRRGGGRGKGKGKAIIGVRKDLAGTVYDIDFDEFEENSEEKFDLRMLRERRKSADIFGEGRRAEAAISSPPILPKCSPLNIEDGKAPLLLPVDMRTHGWEDVETAPLEPTLSEIPQLLPATQSNHVINSQRNTHFPVMMPGGEGRGEELRPFDPDSRNQLKFKIKGPFLDANYGLSSSTSSSFPPQPDPPIFNTAPSNLRRMRKKELLRQYCAQDMNMDSSNSYSFEVQNPSHPPNRSVITIPKAVASMAIIPTKDDYRMDGTPTSEAAEESPNPQPPTIEKKRRNRGVSREIAALGIQSEGPRERRRERTMPTLTPETTNGRKRGRAGPNNKPIAGRSTFIPPTLVEGDENPSVSSIPSSATHPTPKLKIKFADLSGTINNNNNSNNNNNNNSNNHMNFGGTSSNSGANHLSDSDKESPNKKAKGRPPKKRGLTDIPPPCPPTMEELKRQSMKFREKIMANFVEQEKRDILERSGTRKKRKNKKGVDSETDDSNRSKSPEVKVITDSTSGPKLILRFNKKPDDPSDALGDLNGPDHDSGFTGSSEGSSVGSNPIDPPLEVPEVKKEEEEFDESKLMPIRLKLSRCYEGYSLQKKEAEREGEAPKPPDCEVR